MKENTLLKIALICSLTGLIVLYFISSKIEIKDYKPDILNKNIGDDVKVKGTVRKISEKANAVFIEVNQEYPINVVLFTKDDNPKLKNGDFVDVVGKVQQYNGKNEIVADNIQIIR